MFGTMDYSPDYETVVRVDFNFQIYNNFQKNLRESSGNML